MIASIYPGVAQAQEPNDWFESKLRPILIEWVQKGAPDPREAPLLVWTTEFGRTRFNNTADAKGLEHHPWAFSSWLAGAGVKPGIVHGVVQA